MEFFKYIFFPTFEHLTNQILFGGWKVPAARRGSAADGGAQRKRHFWHFIICGNIVGALRGEKQVENTTVTFSECLSSVKKRKTQKKNNEGLSSQLFLKSRGEHCRLRKVKRASVWVRDEMSPGAGRFRRGWREEEERSPVVFALGAKARQQRPPSLPACLHAFTLTIHYFFLCMCERG